jgi:hypothetical protein
VTAKTKKELVAENERMRNALIQAAWDMRVVAGRTHTEGVEWAEGYLTQAAGSVDSAVGK